MNQEFNEEKNQAPQEVDAKYKYLTDGDIRNHSKKSVLFTKKSYYALTFGFFGLFVMIFVFLTWLFAYLGVFEKIIALPFGNMVITALAIITLIIMIVDMFIRPRVSDKVKIAMTVLMLISISLLFSLLISFIWQSFEFTSYQVILTLAIPGVFLVFAGIVGMSKFFDLTKWYIALAFAVVALLVTTVVSWFVFNNWIAVIVVAAVVLVFFILTAIEMHMIKRRAQFIEKLGQRLTVSEVIATSIASAFQIFYFYIYMLYYIAMIWVRQ
ncbi:MAG0110 family membrane protein [Mycoplasmopsis agassizii]|uniref:MAG0110 family membrane protein n=1 Tax=Mycoplasmopsis agassizii TaxID=33922 RepID=UPI00352770D5